MPTATIHPQPPLEAQACAAILVARHPRRAAREAAEKWRRTRSGA